MRNVLADLALESEASMALACGLARAVDEPRADPGGARAWARRPPSSGSASAPWRRWPSAWRPGAATATRGRRSHAQAVPRDAGEFGREGSGNVMRAGRAARAAARTWQCLRWRASWTRPPASTRLRRRAGAMARQPGRPGAGRGPGPPHRRRLARLGRQAALLIQHAPAAVATPSWAAGWRRAAAFSANCPPAPMSALSARAWPDAVAC